MALQSGEALTPGYSRMQGRTQPGRALSVYVPLQLCSATVPGASRNDTALMGDYLGYRSENFWGWNAP